MALASSVTFIAYCIQHAIVREPVAGYTHDQNARAEGRSEFARNTFVVSSAALTRRADSRLA
jgi:hypothetical protein